MYQGDTQRYLYCLTTGLAFIVMMYSTLEGLSLNTDWAKSGDYSLTVTFKIAV